GQLRHAAADRRRDPEEAIAKVARRAGVSQRHEGGDDQRDPDVRDATGRPVPAVKRVLGCFTMPTRLLRGPVGSQVDVVAAVDTRYIGTRTPETSWFRCRCPVFSGAVFFQGL